MATRKRQRVFAWQSSDDSEEGGSAAVHDGLGSDTDSSCCGVEEAKPDIHEDYAPVIIQSRVSAEVDYFQLRERSAAVGSSGVAKHSELTLPGLRNRLLSFKLQ
eukprot:TRINITY_DN26844_c0_g1_i3.p1 TRINITY_DN26844_c0_g1~~TRINITY_DN26844_c0_g1_i3.p1  ORF type:complete len:104 (+),score=16.56 TRINITY_DN26844_c0_g1_i3:237-548(+)